MDQQLSDELMTLDFSISAKIRLTFAILNKMSQKLLNRLLWSFLYTSVVLPSSNSIKSKSFIFSVLWFMTKYLQN